MGRQRYHYDITRLEVLHGLNFYSGHIVAYTAAIFQLFKSADKWTRVETLNAGSLQVRVSIENKLYSTCGVVLLNKPLFG